MKVNCYTEYRCKNCTGRRSEEDETKKSHYYKATKGCKHEWNESGKAFKVEKIRKR